ANFPPTKPNYPHRIVSKPGDYFLFLEKTHFWKHVSYDNLQSSQKEKSNCPLGWTLVTHSGSLRPENLIFLQQQAFLYLFSRAQQVSSGQQEENENGYWSVYALKKRTIVRLLSYTFLETSNVVFTTDDPP
uniref:Uncharacterized protein n=1 Tax=Romanomermis culicivorax TaxID=13658 RepID=A0A915LAK1_ROMCU